MKEKTKYSSSIRPHENVIQFLGVCLDPLVIVTKYYENGSLLSLVRSKTPISEELLRKLLKGIAAGT